MKHFKAKYINHNKAFSITVNFMRCISDNKDVTFYAMTALKMQVMNPDDYKLLSITETGG